MKLLMTLIKETIVILVPPILGILALGVIILLINFIHIFFPS